MTMLKITTGRWPILLKLTSKAFDFKRESELEVNLKKKMEEFNIFNL